MIREWPQGPAVRLLLGLVGALTAAPVAAAVLAPYSESPVLAARVAAGTLPALTERLPLQPLLVEPEERLGSYGGTWRMAMVGRRDGALVLRTIGDEPLIRWDATWRKLVPGLAQSWESSEDGRVYTLHLRWGVRWSDGTPFSSADIRFWYEDVLSNAELTPSPPAWLTGKGRLVELAVPDERTLVFRFAEPNRLFLQHLATGADTLGPTGFPRHRLERYHPRYNPAGIAGEVAAAGMTRWTELFRLKGGMDVDRSDPEGLLHRLDAAGTRSGGPWPTLGAWMLTKLVAGDPPRILAERNPYYWKIDPAGRQLPYIDEVVFYLLAAPDRLPPLVEGAKIDLQVRHIDDVLGRRLDELGRRGGYRAISLAPSSAALLPGWEAAGFEEAPPLPAIGVPLAAAPRPGWAADRYDRAVAHASLPPVATDGTAGWLHGLVRQSLRNVPPAILDSATYPDPGPSNPCQYFIVGE